METMMSKGLLIVKKIQSERHMHNGIIFTTETNRFSWNFMLLAH